MPIDPQVCSSVLKRLDKHMSNLEKKVSSKDVHAFRTHARRVETWFQEFVPEPERNDRKLLESLRRLRKKAGKVRDLDVQLDLLANLNLPYERGRKNQLLCALKEERASREKKFKKAWRSESITQLRKRLQRALPVAELRADAEPVAIARTIFGRISQPQAPLTANRLHQFRIVGKRARYIAELAGDTPEASRMVSQLKHVQDVIGEWHDWVELTSRAEELFAEEHHAALLAALRNLTRTKFRHAVEALAATRANLAHGGPAFSGKKRAQGSTAEHHAAVA